MYLVIDILLIFSKYGVSGMINIDVWQRQGEVHCDPCNHYDHATRVGLVNPKHRSRGVHVSVIYQRPHMKRNGSTWEGGK